jgi:hypothetical protein
MTLLKSVGINKRKIYQSKKCNMKHATLFKNLYYTPVSAVAAAEELQQEVSC